MTKKKVSLDAMEIIETIKDQEWRASVIPGNHVLVSVIADVLRKQNLGQRLRI